MATTWSKETNSVPLERMDRWCVRMMFNFVTVIFMIRNEQLPMMYVQIGNVYKLGNILQIVFCCIVTVGNSVDLEATSFGKTCTNIAVLQSDFSPLP